MPIRPINDDLAEVAKKFVNEDSAKINNYLEILRSWLIQSGFDSENELEDQLLMCFLRGCKYRMEKVKLKLKLFYEIRSNFPEVIKNRDPLDENVRKIIKMGVGIPLPKTAYLEDPRIVLIRAAKFDPKLCKFSEIMKVGTMINDLMMRDDDQMVICGMVIIIDLANVTGSHLWNIDFNFLQKLAFLNQDASPLRMKGFHVLNPPLGMDTVIKISNSLLSMRHRDRIVFSHGRSVKSLYKCFPRSILPAEYGGEIGPIQKYIDFWEERLLENREYLIKEDVFKAKFLNKTEDVSQGFKKLQID